jgi:hypothetical protein
MDDLITRAQEKRDWHLAQAAKFEAFLATYFDLEHDLKSKLPVETKTDAEKADAPKYQRQAMRPMSGIGADTINAAEDIVRQLGPLSTRDLLPHVLARGIDVGGRDPVATLSARLSGRGDLLNYAGKWYFEHNLPPVAREQRTQKEAADNPAKDSSAASLFQTNQGGPDGTALVR